MSRATTPFDIKSATITGLALVLRSADLADIEAELATRVRDAGDLFSNAPVLIDVSGLPDDGSADPLPLADLIALLSGHTMRAVGIVGASEPLLTTALELGLIEEIAIRPRQRAPSMPSVEPAAIPSADPAAATAATDVADTASPSAEPLGDETPTNGVQNGLFDGPAAHAEAPPAQVERASPATQDGSANAPQTTLQAAVDQAVAGLTMPTRVMDKSLRSGQRVYARGGDLVVLGMVSHGAEVIADGNIHVYGPLRGRAIAGASGDAEARIFAAAMEPELISIAGTYRTTDKPLGADVLGKPAQVRLDGDKLLVEPLKR